MKTKLLRFIIAAAILTLLFSCEEFTEVNLPESQLTSETVFKDVSTANAALADLYARLRESGLVSGAGNAGTVLMANYSDDMDYYGSGKDTEQFNKHLLLSSNSSLSQLWNDSYAQLYAANSLIEGVGNSTEITGESYDRLIGEALFIRAYIHFYLTNLFGEVPYVTSTDYRINKSITKLSTSQVYALLLADLSQAELLLPETYPTMDRVRINKGVLIAFMARVHLYAGNWSDAEHYATATIDNEDYIWQPDLGAAFLKDSSSIIWALHPGVAGLNTKDAVSFAIYDGLPFKPTLSNNLYNSFETGDLRKIMWIKTVSDGTQNYHQAFKYQQELYTSSFVEYSILFRLEEQYLIRAEARAHLGNLPAAQGDLNMTRNRAELPDTAAANKSELLEAILNERRFEFFTEQSHRWLDLRRTGNASIVLAPLKAGWRDTDVLLPIPANELILNSNLQPQNPGY